MQLRLRANMDAERFIHRLAGIGDPSVRVGLAREILSALGPREITALREAVGERAARQDVQARVTLLALAEAAEHVRQSRIPPALRRRVEASSAHGLSESGELGVPEVEDPAALPPLRDRPRVGRAVLRNDWGFGRPLSLGEKKSLARRPDRRLLERALRDAHPDVIRELLFNPRLTEIDVARMCAQRDTRPEVLACVFGSPRWACRQKVRRALAFNPRTPQDIGLALVPMLTLTELREVAQHEQMAPAVRELARRLIGRSPGAQRKRAPVPAPTESVDSIPSEPA